ncbi:MULTISPECIES: YafY family protein [unclassified Paenibacillus]|uniref:helix-turn-helix transcriptional regulator n=1 Tax=unclassified Paenibacillus TaxID=185978 RepID=UPI00095691D1|nr:MULTISPECIES: YafY family protein [unclassified Paenibacillus]ASS64930.1 YafY family transcriptional regulator [Paenibacillus sp. RUD330]SIR01077.1 Predicted DNA-binding transcriptional regulator YafY, contains an HTH and WYL domains [Paenibacillus sp. RU4X]SIR33903.1 Predicted DNA-binding transcriptional regulator YafY, contains an HTH and WYL domains [Paenibacillus sp. RU4T]
MPISRHFEIVYMLLNKKTITAGELAERFGVSTRTIFRDIDVLSAAGIPVYSSKGKGGGISLLDGYSFHASLLSEREQEDLLAALQSLAAADYPEINTVLHKMARLFKKEGSYWLEVDFSPWGSGDNRRQLFPLLRQAIADHFLIQFRYFNTAGHESFRTAEPVQLIFKSKSWYLAAHCVTSGAPRVFKISRMKDVAVTEKRFEPREAAAAIDLAEEHAVRDTVRVTLKIGADGAYRVYDDFDDAMISVHEDGTFTVIADLPKGAWLESYLLSFGNLLEEVGPDDVRSSLLAQIEGLISRLSPSQ